MMLYVMGYPLRYVDVEGKEPEDIILRGKNNSLVIVKTDLVDITVDAGDILGDVGGVYTLEGEDVVVAALDIVGIVDPTGVADFTAGSIELQRGNYLEGAVSYAGILPYIGDVFKLAKLPKHVQTIRRAIELSKVGKITKKTGIATRGLGNPYKDKTVKEVKKIMERHVKSGKLEKRYENKSLGRSSYVNKVSGYSYHIDPGINKYNVKVEPPHIDVNYPNPKPKHVNKKKLKLKNK